MKQPYDATARMQLALVNSEVNDNTTYVTDQVNYGVPEYWAVAKGRGDCEDYALAKLKMLRNLGWPKETLDIGICFLPDKEGHAVLIAHTTDGDYVLDNNNEKVIRWSEAPYRWLERSVDGDFTKWISIPTESKA